MDKGVTGPRYRQHRSVNVARTHERNARMMLKLGSGGGRDGADGCVCGGMAVYLNGGFEVLKYSDWLSFGVLELLAEMKKMK